MTTPISTVFLDIDGTLLDSNDAHAQSWKQTLDEAGVSNSYKEVRKLIGKGGDKLLPEISGVDSKSELGKEITEKRSKVFEEEFFDQIKPFPKVRELLLKMRNEEGLKLGVVTSAKKEEMEKFLKRLGIEDLIEFKVTSDDVENSKPDPDLITCALAKLQIKPDEALMLGDTPYDIQAASKAGVKTVALESGGWTAKDLAGAVGVYKDAKDLLEKFETSPFSKSGQGRQKSA